MKYWIGIFKNAENVSREGKYMYKTLSKIIFLAVFISLFCTPSSAEILSTFVDEIVDKSILQHCTSYNVTPLNRSINLSMELDQGIYSFRIYSENVENRTYINSTVYDNVELTTSDRVCYFKSTGYIVTDDIFAYELWTLKRNFISMKRIKTLSDGTVIQTSIPTNTDIDLTSQFKVVII